MEPIEFKSALIARSPLTGTLQIALFDGTREPECVALLTCSVETARALRDEIGSALQDAGPQSL